MEPVGWNRSFLKLGTLVPSLWENAELWQVIPSIDAGPEIGLINNEGDGLGSITSLTNGSGTVAQTYTYDSCGNAMHSTGSLANPFLYTARDFDSETGLYYYRARYYDPTVGRFSGEDPLEFNSDNLNLYSYVRDNSPNLVDPLGWMCSCHCGCKSCHIVSMLVTGYDNGYGSTGKNPGDPGYGITASGTKAGPGTIAAPRNIPFGTGMFVPGYGCGKVLDRGGRKTISGTHIDVWFASRQQAMNWGVHKNVPVEVCDDAQ